MTGREFKRLVAIKIPDDAIVEINHTETGPDPYDEPITVWYEILGIEQSNAAPKVWLVEAGKVTRG